MPPKAKPGEGIVIIVDVGPAVRASTETTFYSQSKQCLINILQRKIFADKCKDMVGVVLFGTDGTSNKLATNDQYQNITVMQEPKYVDWDFVSKVQQLPRGSSQADWLDALIVAMDLLHDSEEIYFGSKKLVLMTDFNCDFSDDQAQAIITNLRDMEIELTVIGPSLEDDVPDSSDPSTQNGHGPSVPHLNWNGKPKTSRQLAGECLIKRIVSSVDGVICSFDEAISQLIFFEKKSQGSANWNAMLDIGPDLRIPVVGNIKIKRATESSWKQEYIGDDSAAIIKETSYHKKDENQTAVDKEDIIPGYRYGTTLVPFGEENAQLKYCSDVPSASLSVLGFTRSSYVPLSIRSGDQVMVITAREVDDDGAVALSAIIQALKELDMAAVTRKIYRKNANPVLGVLYPEITVDYECLIWVGIPFQEGIRNYSFPSLEKAMSKLTEKQKNVMDQLITAMDLSENGDDEEELDPTVIVNPQLQHYFNCLTHRALNPTDNLPAPQQHVLDILSPPEKQREARDLISSKLKELFPTQKVETSKKKKVNIFADTKLDGSDASTSDGGPVTLTSSDLTNVKVDKVSTATPKEDFLAMLRGDQPHYASICSQMSDVLLQLVEILCGDSSTDRVVVEKIVDAMKSFREEAKMIDPAPYSTFLHEVKSIAKARKLSQFWQVIAQDNLGLIRQSETLKSNVSDENAEDFLKMEEEATTEAPAPIQDEGDYDDMLDDF